ncbi:hypothetical protein EYF80_006228 [Liparis tanakae]|uniref:Uncharacterized protein n=1 Tax=Liparis tanakae TaxID=230148 RepID=A0A4Z2J0A6_9TELE|nr:hypothetical protein EYF80_006228 [Liparis tanakae]
MLPSVCRLALLLTADRKTGRRQGGMKGIPSEPAARRHKPHDKRMTGQQCVACGLTYDSPPRETEDTHLCGRGVLGSLLDFQLPTNLSADLFAMLVKKLLHTGIGEIGVLV